MYKRQREYLERFANGDLEARNKLVEHNLRLVSHILKKYYVQAGDQDDLISIGTIGLIKGISTFKPDKKVRLATYASRCVENEILMHFRSQRKYQGDVSLSDSIDSDREGNALSLMDVISVEDDMLENLDARDSCAKVRRCVEHCLTEREAKVISLRYGLDGEGPVSYTHLDVYKRQAEGGVYPAAGKCPGRGGPYLSLIHICNLKKVKNANRAK